MVKETEIAQGRMNEGDTLFPGDHLAQNLSVPSAV